MRDVVFFEKIITADTMTYILSAYNMSPTLEKIRRLDLPFDVLADIEMYLPTKIKAVKRVREETGLDLKGALIFVNVVWAAFDCMVQ